MSIELKINNQPHFSKTKFLCDDKIHSKLEKYELVDDFMNKYNTTCFLGKQGSGKTTLLLNFVKLYKKCFHHIYVFMPSYSRQSIENNIFDKLPKNQLYEELNEDTINDVYEKIQQHSKEDEKTLIIFDDVQKSLKNGRVLRALKNIIANQRHLKVVNMILLQNYFALDKSLRELINNLIIFKLNKTQMEKIFNENVETHKDKFEMIRDFVFDEPHQWLFINTNTQRMFKKFDEIMIPDI